MNPRVKQVTPRPNHRLVLVSENGETKAFDVKPCLDEDVFQELRDLGLFNSVRPCLGTVRWKNGQDFCPDTLYVESEGVADGQD